MAEIDKELLDAINARDLERCKQRLQKEPVIDLRLVDADGRTVFHYAAIKGMDLLVSEFLAHIKLHRQSVGACLNLLDQFGTRAMGYAITAGDIKTAYALANLGAGLDDEGGTKIFERDIKQAITAGSYDLISRLAQAPIVQLWWAGEPAQEGQQKREPVVMEMEREAILVRFLLTAAKANQISERMVNALGCLMGLDAQRFLNKRDTKSRCSPLIATLKHGHERSASNLVGLGADYSKNATGRYSPQMTDWLMNSPLIRAALEKAQSSPTSSPSTPSAKTARQPSPFNLDGGRASTVTTPSSPFMPVERPKSPAHTPSQ